MPIEKLDRLTLCFTGHGGVKLDRMGFVDSNKRSVIVRRAATVPASNRQGEKFV